MADFSDVQQMPYGYGVISTNNQMQGLLSQTGSNLSTAWPAANLAIFVPVRVGVPVTIYKLVVGSGTTATGNFDVGIYDSSGNRLVSSGATAKGSSTEHILDITDTTIGPGLYYLAMSADGTNNYQLVNSSLSVQFVRLCGVVQMASAYTLPSTATFAAASNAQIPAIAAYTRPA